MDRDGDDVPSLFGGPYNKLIMVNSAKTLVIVAIVLLNDYYFGLPSIRLSVLSVAILVVLYMVERYSIGGGLRYRAAVSSDTKAILRAGVVFLTYMLVCDVVKDGSARPLIDYTVGLAILALLPLYEGQSYFLRIPRYYTFIFGVSLVFAVLQTSGLWTSVGNLFPQMGLVASDVLKTDVAASWGYRVSGATSNMCLETRAGRKFSKHGFVPFGRPCIQDICRCRRRSCLS